MLSIFPQLLSFGLVAPVLLRLVVSIYGFFAGWARYNKSYKWMSPVYGVLSFFLLIGLFTQVVSLLLILVVGFDYWVEKNSSVEKQALYLLVAIILVTFIFTGPGFLAFDLPL